jgi:5,10-methylene-tetrahydrofolate dehydrogenase/methenyl tetrahydrofolate cyclohydrolase
MNEIPREKLIDWQAIASEMDAQFYQATSTMREQLGSVPKIVEVAYTNTEFRKIHEECFEEAADLAKGTGIAYEIDKLHVKDEQSAIRDLRARLSELSADPSIEGIRTTGEYLGVRDSPVDVNWIDPYKDVDCKTTTSDRWSLRGRGWLVKRLDPFIQARSHSPGCSPPGSARSRSRSARRGRNR